MLPLRPNPNQKLNAVGIRPSFVHALHRTYFYEQETPDYLPGHYYLRIPYTQSIYLGYLDFWWYATPK